MRTDAEIQKDVRDEIRWEPRLIGSEINVDVTNGQVLLAGSLDSYPKKFAAEKAASKIFGVTGITNNIKIKIPEDQKRPDDEIKKAVIDAIKWNSTIDEKKIMATVKDGWVTLEGNVEWEFQKSRVTNLAEDTTGVTGVTNHISVISAFADSQDVKTKIDAALKRNFYLQRNNIKVEVNGSKATLSGNVRTLAEKSAAEAAAWSAAGINKVENKLRVNYSEVYA